ncbi:polysaccharide pyruvyl transferase family protein [Oceanobacillus halophilus]|uniref:Polysaccharide pyruvyl transferase domain-containing protein n=1 Tax=Oceanobacillus halophilus TaxID=930130 RepID=A0A495A462_9BACI|nr:polysaccharide pyruvyl transferase family protein [Oceanobacillus halophilus]RKQ34281.1 hypothetical protein D8M06_07830 [Oceanobacillus halophilus]
MKKYVILPSSGDLNRGDQALVWETMGIAKKAGCKGKFYMLAQKKSLAKQSHKIGIEVLLPILKHPSRKFKSKENNQYNKALILKWGSVALLDLLKSLFLLTSITRMLISPFLSKSEKETLNILKESDACFVKGGGFIHSSGKLTDSYTVYFQLFHVLLAQSLGKPVFVMPNSFGPFDGIGIAWLVRKVLNRSKVVTVRESISKKMLTEIGVDSQQFPDLGFALEKNERDNSEVIDLREQYPGRKLVAITARPYRFPRSSDPAKKYQEYLDGIVKFSKWLYENNYLPVFIEHTLSETTHEDDGTCISQIVSKLNTGEYSLISNVEYTCRDLKSIYSDFDFVVGTRFHSVIFALSEGIPSIAITYGGNKGQGIMHDLGIGQYAISISEFGAEKAISTISKLNENDQDIRSHLKKCKIEIDEQHRKLANLVKDYNDLGGDNK